MVKIPEGFKVVSSPTPIPEGFQVSNEKKEEEDKPGFFTSFFAGVGSGAIKIPGGIASLGAELLDLGLDTNYAAEVETFFDDINPFDEIAEKTLTGKITEGLVQIGIPGTVGFKIGSRLAKGAIDAKKGGKYLSFGKAKQLGKPKTKVEQKLDALEAKPRSMAQRLGIASGAIAGATLGESVAFDQNLGTIGDVIGGPTELDTTEGLEGSEEASRRLSNRFKFAIESGLIGAGIGGVIAGVRGAAKKSPLARNFDKDPLNKLLGRVVNAVTPSGAFTRDMFERVQSGKEAVSAAALKATQFVDEIEKSADTIVKSSNKVLAGKTKDKMARLKKLIDNRIKNYGDFIDEIDTSVPVEPGVTYRTSRYKSTKESLKAQKELDDYLNKLGASNNEKKELLDAIGDARYQIDLTSGEVRNISEAVRKNAQAVLDDPRAIRDEKIKAEKILAEADRVGEATRAQLGTYISREYELFKDNKKLFGLLDGDKFRPASDVIENATKYFEKIIRVNRASEEVKNTAKAIIDERIPEESIKKLNPVEQRAARIRKQELIDEEISRIMIDKEGNKDFYNEATDLVTALLATSGRNLDELSPLNRFKRELGQAGLEIEDNILKTRTLKSPELRALFGEIDDPFYNIANTISKQAQFVSQFKVFDDLYNSSVTPNGQSGLFFRNTEEATDYITKLKQTNPEFADTAFDLEKDLVRINSGSPVATKLDGLLTFKPVADVLNNVPQAIGDGVFNNLYKYMVLVPKSFSQQAKTIYSPFTHVRNLLSATLFTTMNGNIFFQNPAETARNFVSAFKGITGNSKEALKKQLRYQRLGILGTNPIIGDLDTLAKETGTSIATGNYNEMVDNLFLRTAGKMAKKARDAYIAEDNFWKIYNFESELKSMTRNLKDITPENIFDPKNIKRYEKLLGRKIGTLDPQTGLRNVADDPIFKQTVDLSPDGRFIDFTKGQVVTGNKLKETFIENMAASITKNNIPNYEYVGEFIKKLRRLPLGTFVAFPAEIIRTGFNTIQRAAREIGTEGFRQTGLRRLAGVISTASVVPAGLVKFGQTLSGVSDDELQALRSFVPSWSENSLLMPTEKGKDGKIKYIDLSYIFPYDTLIRPATTLLNEVAAGQKTGESINKSLVDAGIKSSAELLKPFMSEAIAFEAIADVFLRNGRSRDGRQVFKPGDTVGEQLQKATMHIVETFIPGSVGQIKRLFQASGEKTADKYGQVYDLGDEVGGIFGFRQIEADPKRSLPFAVSDFKNQIKSARSSFIGDVAKGGLVSPGEIIQQYIGAERERFEAYRQMYKVIQDAEKLGMSKSNIIKELRLTKKEKTALLNGRYIPYRITDSVRQIFAENYAELEEKLGKKLSNPLNTAITQINKIYSKNLSLDLTEDPKFEVEIPDILFEKEDFVVPALPGSNQPVTPQANIPAGFRIVSQPSTNVTVDDRFRQATLTDPINREIAGLN